MNYKNKNENLDKLKESFKNRVKNVDSMKIIE